ncbi:MAG: DNA-formamidopyrimidine glycosylase family protein [Acidimicrobiia bacterium]
MPELLEAEAARTCIEAFALRRTIASVDASDHWYLKRGVTAAAIAGALVGRTFIAARRIGKQLLVDTSRSGPTLGLHLGMSGRVVVDGVAAGDPLVYASNRDDVAWYRFVVRFRDGGMLGLRDPRRLGGVELDPDETRFGPDATAITTTQFANALRSSGPVKAALMNQARIAGLGNLLTDEALWRAGIQPGRRAEELTPTERAALLRAVRTTLRTLGRRGGSHTGDLMDARVPGGCCPKDGMALQRGTVGGRTTYWCPQHQR